MVQRACSIGVAGMARWLITKAGMVLAVCSGVCKPIGQAAGIEAGIIIGRSRSADRGRAVGCDLPRALPIASHGSAARSGWGGGQSVVR